MALPKAFIRILRSAIAIIAIALISVALFQRKLLYHPSHESGANGLKPWRCENLTIGFCRDVKTPKTVWLFIHGNAGQAADRTYALPSFSEQDSVFILEYPGYGNRVGTPSLTAFNNAAKQAYEILRAGFPNIPICAVGESIGSGPACALASNVDPPDKIVLIVPFDELTRVASHHFPILPVSIMLLDRWNNVESLKYYSGPVEIFGAIEDEIIPLDRAKTLAASKAAAIFHEISGGHNDWSQGTQVIIRNP